jgi:NAD(P)-dependent dehydrogenase (short-subunit alcohol dehydrogenase family)
VELAGRNVLVTGSNRGLGRAIVEHFARDGARVLCHARTEERARETADAVGGVPVWGDLERADGVRSTAELTLADARELHVLVHNAGVGSPGGIEDVTREQWERTLAVNAAAPLFLTQALLEPLRTAAPPARIVVISSNSGQFSVPKNGVAFPYRMSKAAVNMLTLNLAAALAADRILVNAMHPGWLRTAMGGPDAPVDPADAAGTAHYLATLPDGSPSGLLWEDGRQIPW